VTDGTPDLASAARALSDAWDDYMESDVVDPVAEAVGRLRAALAAHDQQDEPVTIDVDGCLACGRWVSTHFMVDPTLVTQEERDRWHNGGHLEPVEKSCPGCKRYWGVSDTLEPPPEPCKTCQDRGWVWEGNASTGEGTPADCPECAERDRKLFESQSTDDELLARLDEAVATAHRTGASSVTVDLPTGDDLASALRSRLDDERHAFCVPADIYERELAEARSHGEVLARVKTNSRSVYRIPGRSQLDAYVPVPPGTEVLVVRPVEDQEETDGK
jgi:hypothetical protein